MLVMRQIYKSTESTEST